MGFDDLIRKAQEMTDPSKQNGSVNSLFQDSPNDTPQMRATKQRLNENFLKRKAFTENQKKNREEQNRVTAATTSARQQAQNYVQPEPTVQTADAYALNTAGNEENVQAQQMGAVTAGSAQADMTAVDKNNQGTDFTVDRVYMDASSKFSENFMVGLGNMIGDYGDISQMVGAALGINTLTEGNFLSKALQQEGKQITDENATYIPPELQDPKFSISTIMNPDFWLIHGAQFTPQILEILGTMGAGGLVERGVVYGLEKGLTKKFAQELGEIALKKGAREGAEGLAMEAGEQAVKNVGKEAAEAGLVGTTVNTTARGAGAIEELNASARGAGRLLRDTGKVSNAGKTVAQAAGNITGGVLTNMRVSLSNAGEVYNTYAAMKNADGSQMFTQEELAQMASGTFSNNMQYMGMDILSWSMTFGGGRKLLAGAGSALKKTVSEAAQRKISGALVSKAVSPAMRKALTYASENGVKFLNKGKGFQRFATIGAMEGLEESIQEVHEEWSKMKGVEEAAGSLVNYQGKGKQYADSFWDFYTSKEMEGTRTIAGILGAAAGGMFNMKELINKSADDAHQMNTRAQLLKDVIKSGTARHEMQQYQIESAVREQVFQGKESYSDAFINDLMERGIIDEERANDLNSLVSMAVENREKTNLLNMKGKKAYFTSLMQKQTFQTLINDANDKHKVRVGELNEQFSNLSPEEMLTDPKYNEALSALENGNMATVGSLQEQINIAQENLQNLLVGKPAKPIKLNSGSYNGNIFYYNSAVEDLENESLDENPEEQTTEREFSDEDPAVKKAKKIIRDGLNAAKEKGQQLLDQGKSALGKLKESFKKPNPTEVVTNPEAPTAEYKQPSKPIEEMTDEDIQSRADELLSEKTRIEAEMQGKTPEEQETYGNALNEIDKEFDALTTKAEGNQSTNAEPENIATPEEEEDEKFVDKDGKEYTLQQYGKPETGIMITAQDGKKVIGSAMFNKNPDGSYSSSATSIQGPYQRKGLGTALYDKFSRLGYEIKPSKDQKPAGKAFTDKYLGNKSSAVSDDDIENFINQKENPTTNTNSETTRRPQINDDEDTSSNLFDDFRESRRKSRVKGNTVVMNSDEQPETNTSQQNQISESVSAALSGTRAGLTNLMDRGRAFGNKMLKNSGARGQRKYYNQMIIQSEEFGHQFITRMNEVNNSGLWNGAEKPNLYFVHSMNVVNENINPDVPGIYIPSVNAIFMKQNAWDDDITYQHEFLHFNYAYMAETSEMKDYLRAMRRENPELLEQIKSDYWDQTLVSVPRHIAQGLSQEDMAAVKQSVLELNPDMDEAAFEQSLYADPIVVKKGNLFDMFPEMSEAKYQSWNSDNTISELPIEEQLILNEELFAHSQEGARSEKYNMFFEEKPVSPERKTFWQAMNARVDKVFPSRQDKENTVLDALDVPNFTQFTDVNSAIWADFEQRFPKGSFEQDYRERRINNLKEEYAQEAEQIRSSINILSEIAEIPFTPIINQEERISNENIQAADEEIVNTTSETLETENETSSEDLETLSTDTIADSYFDSSKNAAERAITKVISGTISNINKRINAAYAKRIAENNGQYVSPPLFDTMALEQEMFDRAKDSSDVVDFILQMRKSETPEVQLMIKSLAKGQRQNSEVAVLKAFYHVNKNKHNLAPVITTVNTNGQISIEDAKTSMMKSKAQQIYGDLEKKANSRNETLEFAQFVEDMEHIRITPEIDIQPDSLVRVMKFFGDKSVDYDRIMEYGFLTIRGQEYPISKMLKDVARKSVKDKFTYDSKTRSYIPFNPEVQSMTSGTKYDVYGIRPRTDGIDRRKTSRDPRKNGAPQLPLNPYYRPLINAVLSTDAKFKNSKSYRNAEGNLTGVRMGNNAVLSIFEKMSNDILTNLDKNNPYSKQKFMANYANISKDQNGKGKFSNALLSHVYDTVIRTGTPYQVNLSLGIENNQTGTGKILKNQNPDEDSLDQLIAFDQRKDIGKKNKNYFMDLGRFSSSSQRFFISVPIQENLFNKSNMMLKKSPEVINAFNIFKNQSESPDLTFEQFAGDLKNMLDGEIAYLENYRTEINPETLQGISILRNNSNSGISPLTEVQKSDIANYFYNQFLNGLYSNEVIFPGFKFAKNDLIKRSASGSTTFTPIGDNVGNEIIYFHDNTDGDVATDGAAYILKEDFDRIKNTAGKYMPMNGHVKMAHVGVEYNGPSGMNGTTQYDKPLYIAIDENYIKQNPKLKGLYDLMKSRKSKWETQNGAGSADYADGTTNHMVTAVSMSAEKSKNALKAEWAVNINDIDETSLSDFSNKLDGIYYQDNSFKGFSGGNIGVQIVMNNNVDRSVVPSQLISFITTGGGLFGDMENLKQAQQYIFDEMQSNISELENIVNTGVISDITNFIKSKGFFDEDKMDQISKMLLFDENLSVATPQTRELVMNTLKQYIIKGGNRLSTPGTQARVVPSFAYAKKFNIDGTDYEIEELHNSMGETEQGEYLPSYATFDAGLQDYKKTYQKVGNEWITNYQPAEMVAPANLAKQGVRKRQYFISWDGNTSENSQAYRKALNFARQNGMTENEIKRFRIKDKGNLEASFGFYIPGETIMATRIPSHGPQSTGFFEVVDFETTGTSQVQVPAGFTSVTGQDHDGDALFINIKDKKGGESSWNKAFDILQDHWLSPVMQENEINQELTFETEANNATDYVKEKIPAAEQESEKEKLYLHTPQGRRNQFSNTLISKGNIGSVMSLHRTYSILSNYGVEFRTPVQVGDKYSINGFSDFMMDNGNGQSVSRTILSANIANMILDDVKNGLSSKLGINSNTIKYVMPLVNMGVDLGDIAVIMNSDIIQQWNQMNEFNDNIFTANEYLNPDILSNQNKMALLGRENVSKKITANIDFDNINSLESKQGIMNLIADLGAIQNDMHKMNALIRGHNEMETNAFIGQKQLNDFDNFLDNRTQTKNGIVDNFLVVSDDLRTSPLIQNYRKNAELMVNLSEKMDIVFSKRGKAIWNSAVNGNPRNINDEKQRKFHTAVEKFTIAQYLGLAGTEVKQHVADLTRANSIENPNPKNIYNRLASFMARPINAEEQANPNRKTFGSSNILFQHALITNLHGANDMKYIRLNGVISDEDTSDAMRDVAKREFANLPTDLQRDLALYDLVKNGFNGRNSLFPLFSPELKAEIENALNLALDDKNNQFMADNAHAEMMANFMGNNSAEYLLNTNNMIISYGGSIRINPASLKNNQGAWNAIQNSVNSGTIVYFTDTYKSSATDNNPRKSVYVIRPYSNQDIQEVNEIRTGAKTLEDFGLVNNTPGTDAEFFLTTKLSGKISPVNFDTVNPEVSQIIMSKTLNKRIGFFEDLDVRERRIRAESYYKYERKMNRGEFDQVMDYPINLNEDQKLALFAQYEADYVNGNRKNMQYTDQQIRNMSDKQLQNLYAGNEGAQDITERGVGYQNKFAYAKIINRVTKEIANRAAVEQANLIRENNPGVNYEVPEESKDLGVMQSWLLASNIPSDNPALQAAVRKIKANEKVFKAEKAKYMQRLNSVTADLYMEKLGFNPYDGLKGKAKFVLNNVRNFFRQGQAMKGLYGNLIKEELIEQEDGTTIKNMRFHDPEVMIQKLKAGEVSQAEYNFYKETSDMMKEFEPYSVKSPRGGREGYIPHVAPSTMEVYSRKGLLGVMANLKDIDEQLGDVKLTYNGKMLSYNEVLAENIRRYNSPEYDAKNSTAAAMELYKIKTKAIKLLKKGQNEDGTPIRYSNIQIGSTIGDVFMNEFAGERGVKASDMPSWDLNKAFSDYFHGVLFNQGNANFGGFREMLPLLDGIASKAYAGNQPNTVQYVDKVWRQYFLQGAKQHHTKTPAELQAIGVTTDDVIDFITKGSLFYWLGYKGLAVGQGAYALGNVLAGKYNHIKDQGGKAWLQGESRFWKGSESFDISNPLKGLKQSMNIMKKAGFMDINIYDDVSLDRSNNFSSFLGDIALMPMTYSEKWIQGVQFLGNLTDEEYNSLANDENYKLPEGRLNEIESNVTLSQGRGYQPTEQRMVQMYSYGRMATQFSRWIPTTIYNLFGKEDFDIYGNKFIGSYRAFGKIISRFTTGEISPGQFAAYRKGLTPTERERLDSSLRGFGLMTLAAGGVALGFTQADKLLSDVNIFADLDRISSKMIPPAISMTTNLAGF